MAETRIDLLRHGEVVGGSCFRGSTDDPLSATGWRQLWVAVANNPGWQEVITSPLRRCAAFAQAFAERKGLPWTVDDRLRELHFGDWEGRSGAELWENDHEALRRFWQNPFTYPPPNGESLERFRDRVEAARDELLATRRGRPILVISHGGVLRLLLCRARGLPLTRLLEIEVGHGQRFTLRFYADSSRQPMLDARCVDELPYDENGLPR